MHSSQAKAASMARNPPGVVTIVTPANASSAGPMPRAYFFINVVSFSGNTDNANLPPSRITSRIGLSFATAIERHGGSNDACCTQLASIAT